MASPSLHTCAWGGAGGRGAKGDPVFQSHVRRGTPPRRAERCRHQDRSRPLWESAGRGKVCNGLQPDASHPKGNDPIGVRTAAVCSESRYGQEEPDGLVGSLAHHGQEVLADLGQAAQASSSCLCLVHHLKLTAMRAASAGIRRKSASHHPCEARALENARLLCKCS